MAYIIPQTILTETDYDVLRYHLANRTTIEKIITFEGNMFIGRGLKQNRPVPTSSLIFVLQKTKPNKNHKIKIINYKPYTEKQGTDFEEYINSNNKNTKEISQSELQENLANWNFIKQDKIFIDLYSIYKINTDSIFVYYNHKTAEKNFNSKFYFDAGAMLDKNYYNKKKIGDDYKLLYLDDGSYKVKKYLFYTKSQKIKFPQGSQGSKCLEKKYKIIWRKTYVSNTKFAFTEFKNVILDTSMQFISSDNKEEILYLQSLLNSNLNILILDKQLRLGNEKIGIFIVIKRIKNFIKVPKITDKNKSIKQEIIKQTEALLALEDLQLKDFVDFTTTIQKFEQVAVEGNHLVLTDFKGKKHTQKINSKTELIKDLIDKTYNQKPLQEISLHDLKYTPAIDKQEQAVIKDYIDDLVFALYFIIPIKKIGIEQAQNIKTQCLKNQYYQYIH